MAEVDSLTRGNSQEVLIDVNTPSLINLNNICCYSENDLNPKVEDTLSNYHPSGEMKLLITPFDNILKYAQKKGDKENIIQLLKEYKAANIELK